MKKLLFSCLTIIAFLFSSCNNQTTKEEEEDAARVLETMTNPAMTIFESLNEDSNSTSSKSDTIPLISNDSSKKPEK